MLLAVIQEIAGLPDGPGPLDDADWRERVRALPAADQDRLLAEAVALRGGSPHERMIALACLVALEARLDPGDPAQYDTIRWVVLQLPSAPEPVRPLIQRAADLSGDEPLRLRCLVAVAAGAELDGDDETAERAYHRALGVARGTGGWAERTATLALARVYHRQRREFEALVLTRRAAALMEAADDSWGRFLALTLRCGVLTEIGDVERAWVRLLQAEHLAGVLPEQRSGPAQATLHGLRCALFLEAGDAEGALIEQEAHDALTPRQEAGVDRRRNQVLRAAVLRRAGHLDAAAAVLAEAAAACPGGDAICLQISEERFLVSIERDGVQAARPLLLGVLAKLDQDPRRVLWPGWRVALCSRLARRLESADVPFEDIRRIHDLAAAAAIERIDELQLCVEDLPELSDAAPADFAILAEYRERFQREQQTLLAAAGRTVREALLSGRVSLESLDASDGAVRVCAWCERLHSRGRTWLPALRFLPHGAELRISHGICPDCRERVRTESGNSTEDGGREVSSRGA